MFRGIKYPFFIVSICLLVLLGGCGKRYWYRITLKDPKKKQLVKVNIQNLSPQFLSDEFAEEMRHAILKELKKKGYVLSVKDSPMYEFVLKLGIDSFNAGVRNYTKEHAEYVNEPSRLKSTSSVYTFRKPVKAIMISCRLQIYRSKAMVWENNDDLYFFNEYMKDLGRCDGMIRYLIRNAEPPK
jgi:hypothetical protein